MRKTEKTYNKKLEAGSWKFNAEPPLVRHPELDSGSQAINTRTFEEQEENVEYRIRNNEYRSEEETKRLAVPNRLAHIASAIAWEQKENVEYRITNNECRSEEESRSEHPSACGISPKGRIEEKDQSQLAERKENSRNSYFSALKERKITARGNALGLSDIMNLIASRKNIVQGDAIAWGKTNNVAQIGERFRVEPGMKSGRAGLSLVRHPELDSGSHATNNDNSIRQRTDNNYKNSFSFLFFSSFPLRGKSRREKGLRGLIYLN